MTDLNEFHEFTSAGAHYPNSGTKSIDEFTYLALGLAGETGEAVEVIKKAMRDGQLHLSNAQCDELVDELGDVLWYWVRLVFAIRSDPDKVIQHNMDKLIERYPNQFRDFVRH